MKEQVDKFINEVKDPKYFGRKLKNNPEVEKYVEEYSKTYNTKSVNESLYNIHNNTTPYKCSCGNDSVFNTFNKGYNKFCGNSCPDKVKHAQDRLAEHWKDPANVDAMLQKKEKTVMEKYGVSHTMKDKTINDRRKATNVEKYGESCPLKADVVKDKIKNTCIEKYGVDTGFKLDSIQKKAKETMMRNNRERQVNSTDMH